MTDSHSRRRLLAGAGVAATGLLGGCSTVVTLTTDRQRIERTVDIAADETLAVENTLGRLTVTAADRENLLLEGEKRAGSGSGLDDVTVEATREDGRLTVTGRDAGGSGLFGPGRDLDLSLTVPATVGVGRVETTQGDVRVDGPGGGPTVSTAQGDGRVRNVDGDLSVSSEQGDVTVLDAGGVGRITTEQGDVEADVAALAGDATIRTAQGDVTARLGDLDATVTAETETGDVTATGLPLDGSERRVSGALGDGTHALTVSAATGDVTLRRL